MRLDGNSLLIVFSSVGGFAELGVGDTHIPVCYFASCRVSGALNHALELHHRISAMIMPQFVIGKLSNLRQWIGVELLGDEVFVDCFLVLVLEGQYPCEIVVRQEIPFGRNRQGVPPQGLTIAPVRYLAYSKKP